MVYIVLVEAHAHRSCDPQEIIWISTTAFTRWICVKWCPSQGSQSDGDSTNTTIFVGGLDSTVTDEDLRQSFSQYGEIVFVKIPLGKGCGFVQFANRTNAEEALGSLNGTVIGKQTVRLSWGRNPANKQSRADHGSQWSAPAYYGGQVYDYGYAAAVAQDPSMYAAAAATYGDYPVYGSHQQQVS